MSEIDKAIAWGKEYIEGGTYKTDFRPFLMQELIEIAEEKKQRDHRIKICDKCMDSGEFKFCKSENYTCEHYDPEAKVDTLILANTILKAENKALRKQREWVKCSERLPENKTYVICTNGTEVRELFYRENVFLSGVQDQTKQVTHWMILPTYKEDENE